MTVTLNPLARQERTLRQTQGVVLAPENGNMMLNRGGNMMLRKNMLLNRGGNMMLEKGKYGGKGNMMLNRGGNIVSRRKYDDEIQRDEEI